MNCNLLPFDGDVRYFPNFIKNNGAIMDNLLNSIPWKHDVIMMYGKEITTTRLTCWYAEHGLSYKYAGKEKVALPWTDTLLDIRNQLKEFEDFNSCLCNLYPSGKDFMGWHTDKEKEMGSNPIIASIRLGAARKFSFKHQKTGHKVDLMLENGSMLLMQKQTQQFWKHALPKSTRIKEARINLTFRKTINIKNVK